MFRCKVLALTVLMMFGCVFAAAQELRPEFQGQPVYRVGSGVLPPKTVHAPEPKYPKHARKKHIESTVVLKTIVGTDGRAHSIAVDKSGGAEFDDEAIKAVNQWTFDPALKEGKQVNVSVAIEVTFHLY